MSIEDKLPDIMRRLVETPPDELEAIVASDSGGLPIEAIWASQKYLAQKLLAANNDTLELAVATRRLRSALEALKLALPLCEGPHRRNQCPCALVDEALGL